MGDKHVLLRLGSLFLVFPASLDRDEVFCTSWSDFTRSNNLFEAFNCLWFNLDNVYILILYGIDWFAPIKVLNASSQVDLHPHAHPRWCDCKAC